MGTAKPSHDSKSLSGFSRRTEYILVACLCLAAAARVLIYCAAFPTFTNIDEQVHFDVVMKYAGGHVPRGLEPVLAESAQFISYFGTLEYFKKPEDFPEGRHPAPPWIAGGKDVVEQLIVDKQWWQERKNFESSQPPLYYVLAAAWWRLGDVCGIKGGHALYWIRSVNAIVAVLLVWIGFVTARRIFPEESWMRISVPVLLAFFPQDAFYSMENDVLSPITFGLAFLCLIRLFQSDSPSIRLSILTGLAIAATYLTKVSNLPLVALATLVALIRLWQVAGNQNRRAALKNLVVFAACVSVPVLAWMLRTRHFFGDITGSNEKIQMLDWTRKPFTEWWPHPIFMPSGFWTFISELVPAFWRGEFLWHGKMLSSAPLDVFYTVSSIALVALAMIKYRAKAMDARRRVVTWLCFLCVLSSIAFLGLLSIQFDFGRCVNPSRAHPYFVAGRLMSGVTVPFAIIYVIGLSRLFDRTRHAWLVPLSITVLMIVVTISEMALNAPAFQSEYNWFHLK